MLLLDSIYEPRLGYPVYYGGNSYVPITPPYSHPYELYQQKSCSPGFTKSERGIHSDGQYHHHQTPLVYPQFPTPPLSVSPSPSTSPPVHQRPGESFQIKRLLNLDAAKRVRVLEESRLAMRTASVIMKIEDQRVFQVDSTTTTPMTDEESSLDDLHQRPRHHHIKSGPAVTASAAPSESLFICKWEKCYK